MICPNCANEKTRVYATRAGLVNERFRECPECGYKFITKEVIRADKFSIEYKKYLEETGEICKKQKTKNGVDTENGKRN